MNSSENQTAPDQFCLEIASGPTAGEQIRLGEGSIFIGRSEEADVTIDDLAASRKHAEIVFRAGCHMVIDRSSNGTFVNGEIITEHALQPDDEIRLGDTIVKFVVLAPGQEPAAVEPDVSAQRKGAADAKPGVSPLLIVAGLCAAGFLVLALWLRGGGADKAALSPKAKGAGAQASDRVKAAAQGAPDDAAPVGLKPELAIEGAKRMLADARLRPQFVPEVIRSLTQTRSGLAAMAPGKAQDDLAEQMDGLLKSAQELQRSLARTFEQRARFFSARGDRKHQEQSLNMLKAVVADTRAPAYVRAESALQQLPGAKTQW